ncbi:MAG: thioredoxin family protein [Planctomycetota bacterium]|nr:thioredoxin family protein [Planctomycetota bacterium]
MMQQSQRSFAVIITLLACGMVPASPLAAQISWLGDLDKAKEQAAQTRRLVLVHFWSDHCNSCFLVERNVFSKPTVARAIQANYVPVKIQVEQHRNLVTQLRVKAWPTDVILAADGREVYRGVTQQDPNRFISHLDQVAALNRYLPLSSRQASNNGTQPSTPKAVNFATRLETYEAPPSTARNTHSPSAPNQFPSASPRERSTANHIPGGHTTTHTSTPNRYSQPPTANGTREVGQPLATTTPPQNPRTAPWKRNAQQMKPTVSNSFHRNAAPAAVSTPVARMASNQAAMPTANVQPRVQTPNLGLDGFCPVTLALQQVWKSGDPRWGIIHRERLYLFSSKEAMEHFWTSPDQFAPMLSGFDVVRFFHNGELRSGKRKHGAWWGQEIYLFADENSLKQFWSNPAFYSRKVHGLRQSRAAQ